MITLEISLLPDDSDVLIGFTHFWLRYVQDFSPKFHCQKSLLGFNDKRFYKGMKIGTSYTLENIEKYKYKYIYLCGVTKKEFPGVHFAFLPAKGSIANYTSYNGIHFFVTNATRLEIPDLPDGFFNMGHEFTSCKNWQFGVEYFGLQKLQNTQANKAKHS